jgi:hypothetical protein
MEQPRTVVGINHVREIEGVFLSKDASSWLVTYRDPRQDVQEFLQASVLEGSQFLTHIPGQELWAVRLSRTILDGADPSTQ